MTTREGRKDSGKQNWQVEMTDDVIRIESGLRVKSCQSYHIKVDMDGDVYGETGARASSFRLMTLEQALWMSCLV